MNTRPRIAAAFFGVAALLLVAAWWALGSVEAPGTPQPRRGVGRVAKRVELPPASPAPLKSPEAEAVQLPDETIDGVKVTKTCKYIAEWQSRNVPGWVMVDNLQARAQRFTEDDLACLTASGVGNAVLRYAELNPLTPKLEEGDRIIVR